MKIIKNIKAEEIEAILLAERNEEQQKILSRFFKTGKGEYGEGDQFLGIRVPRTRAIVKEAKLRIDFEEIGKLLDSPWHEVRLCGFLLLVEEMKANLPRKSDKDTIVKDNARKEIATYYLANARKANNWDLVDLSCEYIIGAYLRLNTPQDYGILYRLAESDNLWEQRIAIVTTLDLIRNGIFEPTLLLADKLKCHHHDLIHKAIGWTLREIGKRDKETLLDYLEKNYASLPRTSLRYAIERLPEPDRRFWLTRKP